MLDESAAIAHTLARLAPLRAAGHEVVVVDGGSADGTAALAAPRCDRVLASAPGRARQMNAGAAAARGAILLFVHADTLLPPGADEAIGHALADGRRCWGRFDVRLDGDEHAFRVIERLMNLRSRVSGIATGDQAMFVTREAFAAVGGFPDQALMEDVALSARLKRLSRPACLAGPVITSARRWRERGVARTVVLMWRLRLAYALGADPRSLARRYQRG